MTRARTTLRASVAPRTKSSTFFWPYGDEACHVPPRTAFTPSLVFAATRREVELAIARELKLLRLAAPEVCR